MPPAPLDAMFTLIFSREGKDLVSYPINGDHITVGRAPDNTVQLTDPEISRRHCRIEQHNRRIRMADESSNGTFVNGSAVSSATIKPGDHITLGQWTMRIEQEQQATDVTIIDHHQPTRILSFDAESRTIVEDTLTLTATDAAGKRQHKRFSQQEIVLGAHAQADVVVTDEYVSRQHCKLVLKDDATVLVDLGSTNGTFVDGVRIDKIALNGKGVFNIGQTMIEFNRAALQEHITPSAETRLGDLLGSSRAMRELFTLIARAAPSDVTACLMGESGTGKDLVAKELHRLSSRSDKPFVALNCGAIPPTIIESTLFGHERGAFTGAVERYAGMFEQANGGTLFLDEIGEMDIGLQTRLLRVLEDRKVRRLGGKEDTPIDVRLIVATHRDVRQLVAEGSFREDLFYRLFVVPLHLPPLRERPDDIPQLTEYFLELHTPKGRTMHVTDAALNKLIAHEWRGNVRELKNTLARTIVMAHSDIIDAEDILFISSPCAAPQRDSLSEQERDAILDALRKHNGNRVKTSKTLGIARSTLSYKIGKYGIDPKNPK